MRLGVLTADDYLYRKICLVLRGRAEVYRLAGSASEAVGAANGGAYPLGSGGKGAANGETYRLDPGGKGAANGETYRLDPGGKGAAASGTKAGRGRHSVRFVSGGPETAIAAGTDVLLVDLACDVPVSEATVVTMGRGEGDLRIPFSREELIAAVCGNGGAAELTQKGRIARLHGREIRLTEMEAALLARLIAAKGDFVGREELHKSVWQDADGGVLNVYIHYLREKLETFGEKIIISSRKAGYKIDEKFLGGGK